MKVCFPVENDSGLKSKVYGHFGSAPMFVIFDTEKEIFDTIDNKNADHVHGQCNPIVALNGNRIDVIIVGGIGAGAISKLNSMGIKVLKAEKETILENLNELKNNTIKELTSEHACSGHSGGCH